MIAAFVAPAEAQRSTVRRSSEPTWFISGSIGAFTGQGVNDGASSSSWDFGQRTSWQYRVSLEKAIQNQSSIGFVATHVHVPFTYWSSLPEPNAFADGGVVCSGCSAHLDLESVAAMFHAGGGIGFHQVIEASLGASVYRNLTRDSDGKKLTPTKAKWDGTFAFGYGFGFGLSQETEVIFVQEYGWALHESTNLPNNASNTNRLSTLRLGIRYGFGSTQPGVRRR